LRSETLTVISEESLLTRIESMRALAFHVPWMLLVACTGSGSNDNGTGGSGAGGANTDASSGASGAAGSGGVGTGGSGGVGAGGSGGVGTGGSGGVGTGGSAGVGTSGSGGVGTSGSGGVGTSGSGGVGGSSGGGGGAGGGNAGSGGAKDAAPPDSGDARSADLADGSLPIPISTGYPKDNGIGGDPRVLFSSNFENGLTGFTRYTQDASHIAVLTDAVVANGGEKYLRAQVTRTQLAANPYISANAQYDFSRRVPQVYWRFYARFVGTTAVPHHWVRVGAGDPTFQSDGLANTVPAGDKGFWFDLDARRDQFFSFYVYWYKMRSGRCNDGTTVPGCAGDQGTTYFYGNDFTPAGQSAFPRDAWFCLEIMAKANVVGQNDGELALWKNDALVGEYRTGTPRGRWLRASFYSWGPYFQDVQAFEGFDFRSSADVLLKRITLDAYYEKGSLDDLAMTTPVPEAQIILYDDVVVATERIGCKIP
jgi:hypothetical protein